MKKWFIIPLMMVYLTAMSGVAVHLHYCCDRLVDVTLGMRGDGCGGCEKGKQGGCKTKKRKKCCTDKEIVYKGSQEQKATFFPHIRLAHQVALLPETTFPHLTVDVSRYCLGSVVGFAANAPPGRWQDIPLYKLHSQRVYYAQTQLI